jgi:hypothetical protein
MSQTEHTFESIFDIGDSMISDCEQQYDTDTENLTSSSISWVCQFEDEIGSSLDDMQFIITDKVKNDKQDENRPDTVDDQFDIDKAISQDCKDLMNDLEVLKYQKNISDFLRNYVHYYIKRLDKSNVSFDTELFIKYLDWLESSSKHLSQKLQMPNIKHNARAENVIPRSSYKFCDYGSECDYNYGVGKFKSKGCIAQHYVHNVVHADINILKLYISKMEEGSNLYSEILKSMNTISFVFSHMYNELSCICYYDKENGHKLHKERRLLCKKPLDKGKKRSKPYNKRDVNVCNDAN